MKKKKDFKKEILSIALPIIILSGVVLAIVFSSYEKGQKMAYDQFIKLNLYSKEEVKFLDEQGFLDLPDGVKPPETKEQVLSFLKSPSLVEQKLDGPDESFEVLATKLDVKAGEYKLAFKLENKSDQSKDFYLIPVSDENQTQFQEIKGQFSKVSEARPLSTDRGRASDTTADVSSKPLSQLYDVEKHKKELKPELAQAYDKIKSEGYQAKPIKITLGPQSSYIAQSEWQLGRGPSSTGSEKAPVYFLVYGSAGGARDDLTGYDGVNNITGVELLIRTRDKYPGAKDRRGYLDRGDIISIAEYGHQWSESERNASDRMIIRLPGITQEDLGEYLLPSYDKDRLIYKDAKMVRQRKYEIDLDRVSEDIIRNLQDHQAPASNRLNLFKSLIKDTSIK